jgi:hypothetical protein
MNTNNNNYEHSKNMIMLDHLPLSPDTLLCVFKWLISFTDWRNVFRVSKQFNKVVRHELTKRKVVHQTITMFDHGTATISDMWIHTFVILPCGRVCLNSRAFGDHHIHIHFDYRSSCLDGIVQIPQYHGLYECKINYINGVRDGVYSMYWNRELKQLRTYKNGCLEGILDMKHGNVRIQCNMKNGYLDGLVVISIKKEGAEIEIDYNNGLPYGDVKLKYRDHSTSEKLPSNTHQSLTLLIRQLSAFYRFGYPARAFDSIQTGKFDENAWKVCDDPEIIYNTVVEFLKSSNLLYSIDGVYYVSNEYQKGAKLDFVRDKYINIFIKIFTISRKEASEILFYHRNNFEKAYKYLDRRSVALVNGSEVEQGRV